MVGFVAQAVAGSYVEGAALVAAVVAVARAVTVVAAVLAVVEFALHPRQFPTEDTRRGESMGLKSFHQGIARMDMT